MMCEIRLDCRTSWKYMWNRHSGEWMSWSLSWARSRKNETISWAVMRRCEKRCTLLRLTISESSKIWSKFTQMSSEHWVSWTSSWNLNWTNIRWVHIPPQRKSNSIAKISEECRKRNSMKMQSREGVWPRWSQTDIIPLAWLASTLKPSSFAVMVKISNERSEKVSEVIYRFSHRQMCRRVCINLGHECRLNLMSIVTF